MSTTYCKNVVKLYQKLIRIIDLNDYSDDNWCEDYSSDEYFLHILSWGGWLPKRQDQISEGVRNVYLIIDKKLNLYGSDDIAKLSAAYPYLWQKDWLKKLIDYLVSKNLTSQDFVDSLIKMGYEEARLKLQEIIRTDSDKIVDCWLRDVVKLDAFPIDSRIRTLLSKYNIPKENNFIIDCCKTNGIRVRPFARALYHNADRL